MHPQQNEMISKLSDTVGALNGHIEGQQVVIASLNERLDKAELKQASDHQLHQAACAQQDERHSAMARRLETQQGTIAELTAQLNKTHSKHQKRLDNLSVQLNGTNSKQAEDAQAMTSRVESALESGSCDWLWRIDSKRECGRPWRSSSRPSRG